MRERDINRKLFHKGHYEVIAKRFREAIEPYMQAGDADATVDERVSELTARSVLVMLAIDFAKRLQADNEEFDPLIFLDRCSPDPTILPLSELWADANEEAWEHDG